jgi:hypothetical protein
MLGLFHFGTVVAYVRRDATRANLKARARALTKNFARENRDGESVSQVAVVCAGTRRARRRDLTGPKFALPFPVDASGHAVVGGVVFQTPRKLFGTDKIPCTNSRRDAEHDGRAGWRRVVSARSRAEKENSQSGMYLGTH